VPEDVQEFIEEERAAATYDPRYHGLYDCRNLMLEDVYVLAQEGKALPWSTSELARIHGSLYDVEVKHRAKVHYARLEEYNVLHSIVQGWHRPKDDEISFRGDVYEVEEAKKLLKKVNKELTKDFDWLKEFDRRVFLAYFQMALHLGQDVAEDLFKRYRFHTQLQKIWQELRTQEENIQNAWNYLCSAQSTQVQEHEFREALTVFRTAHRSLKECLHDAQEMIIPPLKNMPAGTPLRDFLLDKKLVEGLSEYETTLKSKWIDKLRDQCRQVKLKADRIHYKSLGRILALQEKIGADCLKLWGMPEAASARREHAGGTTTG
jgi:hypothetical protein